MGKKQGPLVEFLDKLLEDRQFRYAEDLLLALLNEDPMRLEFRLKLVYVYICISRRDLAQDQLNTTRQLAIAKGSLSDEFEDRLREVEASGPHRLDEVVNVNSQDEKILSVVKRMFSDLAEEFEVKIKKELSSIILKQLDEQPRPPQYLRDIRYEYLLQHRQAYAGQIDPELLRFAVAFNSWFDYFPHCFEQVTIEGMFLEFGVWTGGTINFTARHNRERTIHGFDAFLGLPERWGHHPPGYLSLEGQPPVVEENVKLHIGYFADTLPVFLDEYKGALAFVHIDCDIYSSTLTVLDAIEPRLRSGTVIVFDEYLGEEQTAFEEFTHRTGIKFQYIAYVSHSRTIDTEQHGTMPAIENDIAPFYFSNICSVAICVESIPDKD
tara:strand:+ start:162 stop:1304 length:1143 start_codon:yes stop_codon:yes gene_type:complete